MIIGQIFNTALIEQMLAKSAVLVEATVAVAALAQTSYFKLKHLQVSFTYQQEVYKLFKHLSGHLLRSNQISQNVTTMHMAQVIICMTLWPSICTHGFSVTVKVMAVSLYITIVKLNTTHDPI